MPTTTHKPAVLNATVCTSLDAFAPHETSWRALLESAGAGDIYFDPEWLRVWVQHFDATSPLFIVLVFDGQTLVGGVPFKIGHKAGGLLGKPMRRLQFIGNEPSNAEGLFIVTHPDYAEDTILDTVADTIWHHRPEWDVVDLALSAKPQQLEYLCKRLLPYCYGADIAKTSAAPYMALPATMEEYREKCQRPRLRKRINNGLNRLKKDFPDRKVFLNTDIPATMLDTFAQRHIAYWQNNGIKSEFVRYPAMLDFYKNMFTHYQTLGGPNRVYLSQLQLDDEVLSYQIGFRTQDTYTAHMINYQESYDWYSPGLLQFEHLFWQSIEDGLKCFDMGRGETSYKTLWTDVTRSFWDLTLYPTPQAYLQYHADTWLKLSLQRLGLLGKAAKTQEADWPPLKPSRTH